MSVPQNFKIIVKKNKYGWRVQIGDRWANGLGPDEALGVIAANIFSGSPPPYLRTTNQWKSWRKWLNRKPKEITNGK